MPPTTRHVTVAAASVEDVGREQRYCCVGGFTEKALEVREGSIKQGVSRPNKAQISQKYLCLAVCIKHM